MYRPSVALKYLDSYLGKYLIVNPRYTIRLACLLASRNIFKGQAQSIHEHLARSASWTLIYLASLLFGAAYSDLVPSMIPYRSLMITYFETLPTLRGAANLLRKCCDCAATVLQPCCNWHLKHGCSTIAARLQHDCSSVSALSKDLGSCRMVLSA